MYFPVFLLNYDIFKILTIKQVKKNDESIFLPMKSRINQNFSSLFPTNFANSIRIGVRINFRNFKFISFKTMLFLQAWGKRINIPKEKF